MAGFEWTGRDDGPGPEHRRFFHVVTPIEDVADATDAGPEDDTDSPGAPLQYPVALVGFASDEGVRRNHGRPGAASGPDSIRAALASLAVHDDQLRVLDLGDVAVTDGDLEGGQARLGAALSPHLDAGRLTVVLGGGHETAYGSHLGLQGRRDHGQRRLGILNIDAHFDLRDAPRASSGTPFLQIARDEQAAGREFVYGVVGISEANNTRVLFDRAADLGVHVLMDDDCQQVDPELRAWLDRFLTHVDELYLTIDLDVLPAAVAPGVSAPAALGVPTHVVQYVCDRVADSGKLVHLDVVELCPPRDIDSRTAKVAARLVARTLTRALESE